MKQYYYKNNDCKALHATDAECICWHDEGTGPFPGHRIGVHTCHLRDKPEANKLVSDTPRTDAAIGNSQDRSWMDGTLCRQLERELNEANERIKQLEEQNYTLRARLYPARPRIPTEKKLAIADAPQNISISELARKFDVSYGTVARYRRQNKAKEVKL